MVRRTGTRARRSRARRTRGRRTGARRTGARRTRGHRTGARRTGARRTRGHRIRARRSRARRSRARRSRARRGGYDCSNMPSPRENNQCVCGQGGLKDWSSGGCKAIHRDFPVLTDTSSTPGQHRVTKWYRIMQNNCDGSPENTNIKQLTTSEFTIYHIDGKGAPCGEKVLELTPEIHTAAALAMKRYAQAAAAYQSDHSQRQWSR